jgi:beta-lactam-binding protein with PASTA domain
MTPPTKQWRKRKKTCGHPAPTLLASALLAALALAVAGCGGESETSVPSVVGKPVDSAVNDLSEAGLPVSISRTSSSEKPGQVVSQTPAADESVPNDTTVVLEVSVGEYVQKVPSVTGQGVDEATATLQSAGFAVGLVGTSNAATPGTVVETEPAADTQAPVGSVVELIVSKGPANTEVPNVVGKKVGDAVESLTGAGFVVAPRAVFSEEAKGQVVAQAPAGGQSAAKGATIEINVSKGTGTVSMPSLKGLTADAAEAQLAQLGLETTKDTVPGPPPEGTVIAQSPEAGTTLQTGDSAHFNLSDGAKAEMVSVPNLVGLSRSEAQTQLTQLGLDFTQYVVPSDEPVETVVAQDPARGTSVAVGSSVHFNTSGGQ